MATGTKKISDYTIKTNVDLANDKVVVINGTSTYNMQMQKIRDVATEAAKEVNTDGILIYCVEGNQNRCIPLSKWNAGYKNTHTAIGVMLQFGVENLMIALDDATLVWSSGNVTGHQAITNKRLQFADFDGEAHTNAAASKSQCQGNSSAIGFCHSYAKLTANNRGIGAGKWWLPSMGQKNIIWSYFDKINYVLSCIDGATPLAKGIYWTSTETAAETAMVLDFASGGYGTGHAKTTTTAHVRPVTVYQ